LSALEGRNLGFLRVVKTLAQKVSPNSGHVPTMLSKVIQTGGKYTFWGIYMGVTVVTAWVCDVCGYVWLQKKGQPIRCNGCRSRRWNDSQS